MTIVICILNGFFWALFDVTRKLSLKYISPKVLLTLFMIVQFIFFFSWVCFEENFRIEKSYFIPGLILVLISVISAIIFLKSLVLSDLSLTIPLLSLTPIFSSFFSYLVLNETLKRIEYYGILIIVLGTLILYAEKFELRSIFKSFERISLNVGARLMVLVSVFWSITPIIDKVCLNYTSVNVHGLIQSFGMLLFLLIISRKELTNLNKINKSSGLIIITLCVGTIATVLQFYAILENYVAIMEAIKRTLGQTCAVLFGFLIFKEKISLQKIVGVIILSTGVFFIL